MNFLNCNKIKIDDFLLNNIVLNAKKLENASFILNTKKEKYTLIEKFIYEIAHFHLKNLNVINNSSISIEFSFKNKFNSSLELETYENVIPILKTLTFLNESENYSIITNIDNESYKFKNFGYDKNVYLCLHKKLNHLSFDGGNFFHSDLIQNFNSNLADENLILLINIWNVNLINKNIFSDDLLGKDTYPANILTIDEAKGVKKIELQNNFFEKIFYLKEYNLYKDLYNEINQEDKSFDNFIFINEDSIENKIENLRIRETINISQKKFIQRFNYKNFYNTFSCNWLINEINNYLKNNKEFVDNTNKINVENVNSILNFILFSFQQIIKFICISYSIEENNKNFQITDIFIIKNNSDVNSENNLDISNNFIQDKCSISIKILLNNNFNGGHIYFDDELSYFMEKGELLIHNGNDNYKYELIENGTQYILSGLINIYNK